LLAASERVGDCGYVVAIEHDCGLPFVGV
jgi:hypothetical protein